MKKTLLLAALVAALAFTSAACAKDGHKGYYSGPRQAAEAYQGGYTGPAGPVVTSAEALKMGDDAPVTLVGKLESQIGDDKFTFRDGAGTVVVEIEDYAWGGQAIGPEDTVELAGQVDRDWNKVKVEVYRVTKK